MILNYLAVLLSRTAVAVFLFLAIRPASAQMIDTMNTNGMSDVWEQLYGASGLSPNGDADGDGFSNLKEALAGSNPFDANSVPKITSAIKAAAFTVTIPCELGKQYQLQSVTDLGSTNWIVETNVVVRSGTNLTLMASAGSVGKFFRTAVSDVDTDGDGVNDWEEYKLGLDPLNPMSNNTLDGNGQLMNDYAYATGKFAAQNIFSIAATDPTTVQPDPGTSPTDLGVLTVSRGGFALKSITVNLALGGPGSGFATEGVDHATLPRTVTFPAGVSSQNISVTPLADTNLHTAVIAQMKLLPGTNYTTSYASNASVVIYPSATANGTGLSGNYYTNASVTYASVTNFNSTNLILSRVDTNVDFVWGTTTSPITNNGYYTVRWTGQVLPQYSETYYFVVNSDDGCKLWVNDQLIIDKWQSQSASDNTGIIALQAGVRYNIKLEYLQITGTAVVHLNWYSASQPKQIIPPSRLFPTNVVTAPSSITCALSAVAFLGQPFSFTVTGANTPLAYTASGLPPGLGFTNGVISGIPNFAGTYQTMVTSSNTVGLGSAAVSIQVIDTGSSVVREVWAGVTGTNIADIPVTTPATLTNTLGTLEGITNYGSNYGERIRGYLTAPVTGNYYFWIAGSDSAEAWIANDNEPANKLRRANVFPANGGTTFRNWNSQTNQQSKWLSLVAGQKYYVEILHKAGTTPDHWSVGWSQDPVGTNTVPSGVVPGYVLARYYPLPVSILSGTLYSANMLAQNGVLSSGLGSATLQVSADGTQAILRAGYSGLSSTKTGEHIHCDPYLNSPSQIMFDVDAAPPQPDGSYVWNIGPVGTLQPADIIEIIREGKAYLNVHTVNYPAGEINGHFTLANGTQTFTPPPAPPAWTDDHTDTNAAARFLIQSTFGPSLNDITNVQSLGYSNWISAQFALPITHHLPVVLTNMVADPSNPFPSSDWFNTWWQNSVTAPDQLRQRVAFALSEILVVSESGTLQDKATALAAYYDTLVDNAFGNYRDLLKAVTLTPAMGLYLNMQANTLGSLPNGTHPNENYAREINQLFSVGLYHLWPDGTLVLNSQNSLVPTYDQSVVSGFAATFTGWNYYQTNQANGRLPTSFSPSQNLTNPMVLVPAYHDLGTKKLLDIVMIPAAVGTQVGSSSTNDLYCSQNLEAAFDSIFNNPNVGPFICRQLIQRLVTSNPSRNYLYRVTQKFNDNGSGVRGDLKAVVQAILLDYEARSTNWLVVSTYGKQREPLLRVTATARAFAAPPSQTGTYVETGNQTNTITLPSPHRMANGDTVAMSFTDTSGNPAPPNQNYSVTVINSNTFTVNMPNLLTGIYAQTNNIITVTIAAGHGLVTGNAAYLVFTTGGAASGPFSVTVINSTVFNVTALDTFAHTGNCLLSRISASGLTQSGTNITVSCAGPHALLVNETIYIPANSVLIPTGQYQVKTIPDPLHFTFVLTNSVGTQSGFTLYPLGAPSLTRNGNATVQWSTWNLGYTDSDPTYNLAQSPLSANTVFNFFFPNYAFPGALSAAGLTTPEFQLTSDTSTALQMNFLEAGILNNTANTNGLSSFNNGGGAIVLDIGPWMTTNYTAAAGVPSLVDNLNTLLLAGQLSVAAKTNIVNYVTNTTNFSFSSPPTQTQIRDRVRAVVHLIVCSPDFTIQK